MDDLHYHQRFLEHISHECKGASSSDGLTFFLSEALSKQRNASVILLCKLVDMILDNKSLVCGVRKEAREAMTAKIEPMVRRFQQIQDRLYQYFVVWTVLLVLCTLTPVCVEVVCYLNNTLIPLRLANMIKLWCNLTSSVAAVCSLVVSERLRRWKLAERVARNVLTKMRYAMCFDAEAELKSLRLTIPTAGDVCVSNELRVVDDVETIWERSVFRDSSAAGSSA